MIENVPELPEVETVKRGLNKIVANLNVNRVQIHQPQLRYKFLPSFSKKITKAGKIKKVSRRAKYLIFEFEYLNLLNHLGMTGNWKLKPQSYQLEKHDHIEFTLSNKKRLIYNDPRRFGWLEVIESQDGYFENKKHGPEPLSKAFQHENFYKLLKTKNAPIKSVIMDQKNVLGVGNIYACESLFRSGIRPTRKANKVTKKENELLVKEIKSVLKEAIKAGGSTIKDFKKAGGESGYFQTKLNVYGRKDQACQVCSTQIKNIKITGRSSFYCPNCQQ